MLDFKLGFKSLKVNSCLILMSHIHEALRPAQYEYINCLNNPKSATT